MVTHNEQFIEKERIIQEIVGILRREDLAFCESLLSELGRDFAEQLSLLEWPRLAQ